MVFKRRKHCGLRTGTHAWMDVATISPSILYGLRNSHLHRLITIAYDIRMLAA